MLLLLLVAVAVAVAVAAADAADGAIYSLVSPSQVPVELIAQLPASTPVLQHYVASHAAESYVRAEWLLGTLIVPTACEQHVPVC